MTDWISVKDKFPEFDESVLVWCPIWGMYLASYNRILDTNWGEWRDFNNKIVLPPIYWMPLPERPKQ